MKDFIKFMNAGMWGSVVTWLVVYLFEQGILEIGIRTYAITCFWIGLVIALLVSFLVFVAGDKLK